MATSNHEIAETFNLRAGNYARNEWHRTCAERLVALCSPSKGSLVLDACTGTGFAAIAAAKVVGDDGYVYGVDISSGMLHQANIAILESGLTNIELLESDVVMLTQFKSASFDLITCAAGLLYLPINMVLNSWHRLLKKGGTVAFSTMQAGSPPAAHIFRSCAAEFGVQLNDPSEALGSVPACRIALEQAGFEVINIINENIGFSEQDLSLAWESNFHSAAHLAVQQLSEEKVRLLKHRYQDVLANEEREHPGILNRSGVLYAIARR